MERARKEDLGQGGKYSRRMGHSRRREDGGSASLGRREEKKTIGQVDDALRPIGLPVG